jgi:hypothetical protein
MTQPLIGFIPSTSSHLGRHINHDPRSRLYPYRAPAQVPLVSTRHVAAKPILDQDGVGACTGFAGIRCLHYTPFFETVHLTDKWYNLDNPDGLALYSENTKRDPYVGTYPPTDTGSDGLTTGKVLTSYGEIAGYEHAFSLDQALQALMSRPFITGTYWYDDMFNPDSNGIIHPGGNIAGGHEYVVDEYVAAMTPLGTGVAVATEPYVGISNSWGPSWGVEGRAYMSTADYGRLLDDDGDVTIFTPADLDPPTPIGDPDSEFAAVLNDWLSKRRWFYKWVQDAAREWLAAKDL